MICPECKQGAQILAMPVVMNRGAKAEAMHKKCTNPHDCPCQHEIALPGDVITRKHDG
jgi:hypothetical protein